MANKYAPETFASIAIPSKAHHLQTEPADALRLQIRPGRAIL